MSNGLFRQGACLALVCSASLVWGQQPVRTPDGIYDVRTIKEVTSITKLNQVCLEELAGPDRQISLIDEQKCACVVYELGELISYGEYKEIEKNILYDRGWKSTEAMERVRPHLREACNWKG
ncbi:MAG: hypothetical protein JKY47_22470 [Thalassospira sp.]|nr:hypothetical protein [Thalassospira sp.]